MIVEVSCQYPKQRLLKKKDEVTDAICYLVDCFKCESRKLVKYICNDNGNKFVNAVIREFCLTNGIQHRTTNLYCLKQNGIAERAIAVFMEMTQCMLHGANMDLCYWGEALMYAIYI